MSFKKLFTVLLLVLILSASCAYAKVPEELVLQDQRFAPFIETTKQNGAKLLPGRYMHLRDIASRTGNPPKILAPSEILIEVGNFDPESNAYPTNFDVYGENLMPCYMTFDDSGNMYRGKDFGIR